MVTGTSVGYVGGTQGIALPPRDGVGVRRAHEPAKPKPTGLDWDALTPTCKGCGQRSGQLGDGELCPTCRGVQPTQPKKGKRGRFAAVQLPEDELLRRFTGPDDTALGRALAELEEEDPKVAAAAEQLTDAVARMVLPEDHVRPDALQVDEPEDGAQAGVTAEPHPCGHVTLAPGCGGCDPGAIDFVIEDGSRTPRPFDPAQDLAVEPTPNNVTALPTRYSDDANLDAQVAHAENVLRASAGLDDPVARLLRLTAVSAIESLHLYLELHHQTPAPATCPRPAGAGPTSVEPNPPGLDGAGRPAARPQGEGGARPVTRARRGSKLDPHRDDIVRAYQAGDSPTQIGDRYGTTDVTVRAFLRNAGVTLRNRSEAQKAKHAHRRTTNPTGDTTA